MTREQQLGAMRAVDLIELCKKYGLKVHASKNTLKEARAKVIARILEYENGTQAEQSDEAQAVEQPETVENTTSNSKNEAEEANTSETDATETSEEEPEPEFTITKEEAELVEAIKALPNIYNVDIDTITDLTYDVNDKDGNTICTIMACRDGVYVSTHVPYDKIAALIDFVMPE